ncbi:MAG TPA: glutamate-5-semialdehyde dehydrogenase [Tepidisphaeraceae bacterium]|jgi:glutamate-5-semialdehyde dehydrogenase
MEDIHNYVRSLGEAARQASQQLVTLDGQTKVAALKRIAQKLRDASPAIIGANEKDLAAARDNKLAPALVERLKLNEKKVFAMADSVDQIADQVDPVGQTLEGYVRPNGLRIERRRVPLGVVLFFYESRPNVTSDAAALCLKSGNAVILRGGKEAFHSNKAIVTVVAEGLRKSGINPAAVQFVESTDRALVPAILKLDKYIDLVIPRGGESLIRAVVTDSTIPVLKHFTGNCHIYVDSHIDGIEQQVRDICVNAKTSYPGGAACNTVEHLLFHEAVAQRMIPRVCEDLAAKQVEIRGDEETRALYPGAIPITPEDWDTEYLSFIVGVKTVRSIDEAIDHINAHGSHHTDAILSTSAREIDRFIKQVDSASIMVNASTRFADGGEYGLGAEIGISTDKLHARGPMGAADLTTYKWIVTGDGHTRA